MKNKYKKKNKNMPSPTDPSHPPAAGTPKVPEKPSLGPKIGPLLKREKEAHRYTSGGTPWKIALEVEADVVGIYVASIYHGQLKEMIDSNKINRESLIAIQRASVVFPADEIKVYATIDGRQKGVPVVGWNFSVPIENIGTTRTSCDPWANTAAPEFCSTGPHPLLSRMHLIVVSPLTGKSR